MEPLALAAAAALVLLLILVASWWKTASNDYSGVAGPLVPPPAGAWRWLWQWRETAAFLASHGSGRGFYHFVRTRYLRHQSPCFRTAVLGRVHVFLSASHPAASHLLTAQPPHFAKRYARTAADLLGAHSILCCTSHAHHRHARRALATTLFAAPSTAAFAAAFDRLATDLIIRHWTIRHQVVVLDAALEITYRAICEMLVGRGGAGRLAPLQSDVFAVTQAMLALPLRWVPGTRFRRGLAARKRIMAALREEMAARRHHQHLHDDDLLSLLMQRRQLGHPDALTEEQIQDNMLTLIIAGQVTTATAITWMVKYLSDNRLIQDKLRAEAFGLELKGDYSLTLQDLNGMDYGYKAVKESLRMATIVSWFPRVALKDCQVAGFHIKKDWIVNIDARSLHYDPAVFDNPTVFDPSRFNGEGEGDDVKLGRAQQQGRRLLVFGAGGRTCLGMNLAKIMMLIFLHRLLTNFRWEMADDDPSLEKWAMFPRLKNGCPILLTPIHDSS
uniref:Cytochrome P450 n=1 Tax=Oryza punctata TaxID=4537 RepID=A0A0E0KXF1_ORYPU